MGALRERFDATRKLDVPAHIAVLVPIMDSREITSDVLQQIQRALERPAACSFSLRPTLSLSQEAELTHLWGRWPERSGRA